MELWCAICLFVHIRDTFFFLDKSAHNGGGPGGSDGLVGSFILSGVYYLF